MFIASAVNVVDITLIAAIPGTMMSRFFWSEWKIAPKKARKTRGSRKLKKAAVGLRQNIRRSRRYWRQRRVTASACAIHSASIGGQLEVDVFEAGTGHREVEQAFAALDRKRCQPVEQAGRVVGLLGDQGARGVDVADLVAGDPLDAELGGRADREDAAVLDDRDPVGELLGLVEVVGRQKDGLAELLERADRLPGGAAGGRVEAGRRLVEEDQLGIADQGEGEVEPAELTPESLRVRASCFSPSPASAITSSTSRGWG